MKAVNQWLKSVRNQVTLAEEWKVLGLKLLEHYRCYGISGDMQALREFSRGVPVLAYKWINRRSEKKNYTYARYCKFKRYNPLPDPKIYHLIYTLSSY